MRPRHDVRLLTKIVDDVGDVDHVRALKTEVELLDNGLGEQFNQGRRVSERRHGDAAHQMRGERRHHAEGRCAPAGRHQGAAP